MHKYIFLFVLILTFLGTGRNAKAEDGYRLWLRYDQITDEAVSEEYKSLLKEVIIEGDSPTLSVIQRELQKGIGGLLGMKISFNTTISENCTLIVGTPESSDLVASLQLEDQLAAAGKEGFLIEEKQIRGNRHIVIASSSNIGALYGTFHFLRLLQTHQDLESISVQSAPKIQHRILNHWHNLDRSVERGYAGLSMGMEDASIL